MIKILFLILLSAITLSNANRGNWNGFKRGQSNGNIRGHGIIQSRQLPNRFNNRLPFQPNSFFNQHLNNIRPGHGHHDKFPQKSI